MANYWMHNGFLQVEGEKMSKSLGNFVTIHELLHTENFGGRKWPGEVLRLAMLRTHYRQPIDFTVKALEEAERTLFRWRRFVELTLGLDDNWSNLGPLPAAFLEYLADDLNTPAALSRIHELARVGPIAALEWGEESSGASPIVQQTAAAQLQAALALLGLQTILDPAWQRTSVDEAESAKIKELIDARLAARAAKNWAESDRIRDELAAMGVALKDNKDGTTTWEVKR
jgi:cysteinyl-tRNA synthetase